jgi:hypothetical protein
LRTAPVGVLPCPWPRSSTRCASDIPPLARHHPARKRSPAIGHQGP